MRDMALLWPGRFCSSSIFLKRPTLYSFSRCRRLYQAPRWPRRELYEEYQGTRENGNGGDEHDNWKYEYTWREWIYDRRKYFYRAGLAAAGTGTYYWYHLEFTPVTGTLIGILL